MKFNDLCSLAENSQPSKLVDARWNLIDDLSNIKRDFFTDDKAAERDIVYNLTVKHGLRESDGPIRSIEDEIEYQFKKARRGV